MAAMEFIGANQRGLEVETTKRGSLRVIQKKDGKLFGIFSRTGEQVTLSTTVQSHMIENGSVGAASDYNVVDMPSKDPVTGVPDGKTFMLITMASNTNVLGWLE